MWMGNADKMHVAILICDYFDGAYGNTAFENADEYSHLRVKITENNAYSNILDPALVCL